MKLRKFKAGDKVQWIASGHGTTVNKPRLVDAYVIGFSDNRVMIKILDNFGREIVKYVVEANLAPHPDEEYEPEY